MLKNILLFLLMLLIVPLELVAGVLTFYIVLLEAIISILFWPRKLRLKLVKRFSSEHKR